MRSLRHFLRFHIVVNILAFATLGSAFKSSDNSASYKLLQTPEKGEPSQIPERKLPRCGETHRVESGGIFHKPFESVDQNERCVWIIGVPDAMGYTIDIQYLSDTTNVPGSGQELSLTGARREDYPDLPTLSTYLPTSMGQITVEDSNIVIVTFHATELEDSSSTGFVLQYQALFTGNISRINVNSTHHLFETPTFDFQYPPTGGHYGNRELAAFVFPPSHNIFAGNDKYIWYKRGGAVEEGCRDPLVLYRFNLTTPPDTSRWQEIGSICGDVKAQQISESDMMLILFMSDNDYKFNAFSFSFLGC